MDPKKIEIQPTEGMFDRIQSRLRHRRNMRRGAIAAVVVAVVGGAALWIALPKDDTASAPSAAVAEHRQPSTPQIAQEQPRPTAQVATAESVPQHVSPEATLAEQPKAEPKPLASQSQSTLADEHLAAQPIVQQDEAMTQQHTDAPDPIVADPTMPTMASYERQAEEQAEWQHSVQEAFDTKNETPTDSTRKYTNVVWVPNIIIPNGEVEEGRYFSIISAEQLADFDIRIFARNGHLVYRSRDAKFQWDATSQGVAVPQGAYVWVMSYRDANNQPHTEKGSVVVVR